LYAIFLIPVSIIQSFFIVLKFRPSAVIGVGGFCSGPVLFASWMLRKPIFILEQNTVMGITNRIGSRFAKKVFTAFPLSKYKSQKVIVCGNPVRSSISSSKKSLAKLNKNSTDPYFNIFIFGGSQGSMAINKCITDAIPLLNKLKGISVNHQTGKVDYERVRQEYKRATFDHEVFDYSHDMPALYDQADIVISRAGASTIFELISAKLPSVLIPLPTAADNHQYFNAKFLKNYGACEMLEQKEFTPENLNKKLIFYIKNKEVLVEMIKKLKELSVKSKRPEEIIIEAVEKNV
jgi:UDP-N-acetylglucosamine--N-acetylmuramyl-(pentapeptide) pyrophosphoryl-undecaprenol N-acetylglucosamine transferase